MDKPLFVQIITHTTTREHCLGYPSGMLRIEEHQKPMVEKYLIDLAASRYPDWTLSTSNPNPFAGNTYAHERSLSVDGTWTGTVRSIIELTKGERAAAHHLLATHDLWDFFPNGLLSIGWEYRTMSLETEKKLTGKQVFGPFRTDIPLHELIETKYYPYSLKYLTERPL